MALSLPARRACDPKPRSRHWNAESLEGLSGEADEARERLVKYVGRVGAAARRLGERRTREEAPVSAG